jgi:ubiquinone/menaquinone biosynthesis C-methylase UbiE
VTTNDFIVSRLLNEIIPSQDAYLRVHRKRYERTLSVFLDQKPQPGTLLEVGTSGVFPLALESFFPEIEVHVTDFDVRKAQKGSLTIHMNDRIRKVPAYRVNLETTPLPVEDEMFDYILCSEVIEHMEQDPMFMLSELNRVLKPGGMLILTTPNIASSSAIHRILNGLDPYFYMQYRKAGTLDRHNYEYSPYSLSQTLKAAGFEGYVWTEDTFSTPASLPVEDLKRLGYSMQHLGDNIFTVSKKVGPVVNRYPSVIYSD